MVLRTAPVKRSRARDPLTFEIEWLLRLPIGQFWQPHSSYLSNQGYNEPHIFGHLENAKWYIAKYGNGLTSDSHI